MMGMMSGELIPRLSLLNSYFLYFYALQVANDVRNLPTYTLDYALSFLLYPFGDCHTVLASSPAEPYRWKGEFIPVRSFDMTHFDIVLDPNIPMFATQSFADAELMTAPNKTVPPLA